MILTLGIAVLLAVLAVTPLAIQYAIKKGRVDQPSIRKVHSAPTPRVGGHVFVPIITAAWLIAVPEIDHHVLSLLAAIAIIYTLGIIDDFKDLNHRIKLPFQFLASGIVIYFWDLVPIDMGGPFGIHVIHGWWGWLLMLFFFQFTINALNYTDGVNGLLGGYTLITFSFITVWAYFEEVTRIWPLTFLLAAGVLGFLYFNFRKQAKTFMGDGGSTVIGLIASIVTARMIQVNPHVELSIGQAESHHPCFLRLRFTLLVPPLRFPPSLHPPNPPRLQPLQGRPRTLSPLFNGSNEQESSAQRQHDFINHRIAFDRVIS